MKNLLKIFGAPGVQKVDPNAKLIGRGDFITSEKDDISSNHDIGVGSQDKLSNRNHDNKSD